jgi:chromatin remodeling complex protein RSC6
MSVEFKKVKKNKKVKKVKKVKPVVEESAPAVVEESAPAVVEESAPAVVEESAPAVVEESAPAVVEESAPAVVEESNEISESHLVAFDSICSEVLMLQDQLKNLNKKLRDLQKNTKKTMKELSKKINKKKNKSVSNKERQPSGFAKPSLLSDKLCTFLNINNDKMLARTEVTKKITNYIKENNLQKPENKKIILCDEKLGDLLNAGDEEVTYFNLQKWMKVHYKKSKKEAIEEK